MNDLNNEEEEEELSPTMSLFGDDDDEVIDDEVEEAEESEEVEEEEEEEQTSEAPSATPTVDLATIQQIAEVIRSTNAPPVQAPQFTQEDYDKALKVFKVTPEFATKLLGEGYSTEQEEALGQLVNGMTEHLTTMMSYALQAQNNAVTEKITPLLQKHEQAQLEQFSTHLSTKYPALAPYKQLVNQTILQLRNSGYVPKSPAEADQTVATHVEAYIKSVQPTFSLNAPAPKTTTNKSVKKPQMASLRSGSGGAAQQGAAQPKKEKKPFQALFS
jgi:hypothetical protein